MLEEEKSDVNDPSCRPPFEEDECVLPLSTLNLLHRRELGTTAESVRGALDYKFMEVAVGRQCFPDNDPTEVAVRETWCSEKDSRCHTW